MKQLPKINLSYWVLMIIATTTGEIVGNYISRDLGLGYKTGSILVGTLFIISVVFSIFTKSVIPFLYWLLIIIGNIGGTNIADLICIDLNLGTTYGSLLVISVFIFILLTSNFISRKPSLITDMKVEFLYWLAIITSSTFGTTSGDFLSNDTPLGADGGTVLLLIVLMISILLLHYKKITTHVFYWLAIIIIHPIGATFGNYISKPLGLNLGNVYTSIFLIVLFCITYQINFKKSSAK